MESIVHKPAIHPTPKLSSSEALDRLFTDIKPQRLI